MLRPVRAISLLTRPATPSRRLVRYRHSLLNQTGPVTIQPVRFRRPPLSLRRVSIFAVKALTALWILNRLSEYFLEDEEEDETGANASATKRAKDDSESTQEEKTGDSEEEDEYLVDLPDQLPEDAIFIPLWWGKKKPVEYYKGSDPEWKGYVKFAQDKQKVKAVRVTLANEILGIVSNNPGWEGVLGTPVGINRTWLDFDFPLGPPPEFDRPGIEIADDYIAITTRPQSLDQHRRLKSVLWPESIARSFWASFEMYWSLQYARAKNLVSFKSEDGDSTDKPISQPSITLPKLPKAPEKQGPPMNANMSGPTPSENASKPGGGESEPSKAPQQQQQTPPDEAATKKALGPNTPKIFGSLPTLTSAQGDFRAAMAAFKKTLVRTWSGSAQLDRGACFISGLVEIGGPKGTIEVEVVSSFHPGTGVMKLFVVRGRHYRPKVLRPKAGR